MSDPDHTWSKPALGQLRCIFGEQCKINTDNPDFINVNICFKDGHSTLMGRCEGYSQNSIPVMVQELAL